MNVAKLEQFRQKLEEMSQRLQADIDELSNETSALPTRRARGPEDGADGSMSQFGQDMSLMFTEEGIRNEIAAALVRLDNGTFGKCETCGSAIGEARLKALPYARQCINCAGAK